MRTGFFGVTANLIGNGAGSWLMCRALEIAWSRPIRRVWVQTCSFDHPAALAFYQRSGFRAFRRQIEIASDPRLDEHCRAALRGIFRSLGETPSPRREPGLQLRFINLNSANSNDYDFLWAIFHRLPGTGLFERK